MTQFTPAERPPDPNGSYGCRVTASNQAGSSSQSSAATDVSSNKFEFKKLKRD